MFREYFEYRRNKKMAKRALVKTINEGLPTINALLNTTNSVVTTVNEINGKANDIKDFVIKLVTATKNATPEDIIPVALTSVADALKTSKTRLVEIGTYLATLSPEDIQKVIIHASVQSNKEIVGDADY